MPAGKSRAIPLAILFTLVPICPAEGFFPRKSSSFLSQDVFPRPRGEKTVAKKKKKNAATRSPLAKDIIGDERETGPGDGDGGEWMVGEEGRGGG